MGTGGGEDGKRGDAGRPEGIAEAAGADGSGEAAGILETALRAPCMGLPDVEEHMSDMIIASFLALAPGPAPEGAPAPAGESEIISWVLDGAVPSPDGTGEGGGAGGPWRPRFTAAILADGKRTRR
ncbi:MAG: hypothetical protein LBQ79_10995 [Deltaproteobacteria bacterium]|jgi:hypothetical protein|nr:hypothetical protein [Deltaproteobacteria bacterium]